MVLSIVLIEANVLNSYVNECFNHTLPPISPLSSNDEAVYTCPPDILCTVVEVSYKNWTLGRLMDLMPFLLTC